MINHFPYGNVLGRDHTHILSNTGYACRVKELREIFEFCL